MIWHDVHAYRGDRFRVLHTGERTQIAMITLPPNQSMGSDEGHASSDQVIYVVEGRIDLTVDTDKRELRAGEVAVIPQGTPHRMRATGRRPAMVFSVYGPPAYPAEDREIAPPSHAEAPVGLVTP